MKIPKIIHQTISRKESLGSLFHENIERIKALNPDWEYRLYDEADRRQFILQHYDPDYLRTYDNIRAEYGAAKADFFRYLLVFKMGGVYLDIKSALHRPLSEVLHENDEFLLSRWDQTAFAGFGCWSRFGVDHEFQQWHIIGRPGHPFLEAVIDRVRFNIDHYEPVRNGIGRLAVILATGPIPYTRAIKEIVALHPHRLVNIMDLGFEFSFPRHQGLNHSKLIGNNYRRCRKPLTVEHWPLYRRLIARVNRKIGFVGLEEAIIFAAG